MKHHLYINSTIKANLPRTQSGSPDRSTSATGSLRGCGGGDGGDGGSGDGDGGDGGDGGPVVGRETEEDYEQKTKPFYYQANQDKTQASSPCSKIGLLSS